MILFKGLGRYQFDFTEDEDKPFMIVDTQQHKDLSNVDVESFVGINSKYGEIEYVIEADKIGSGNVEFIQNEVDGATSGNGRNADQENEMTGSGSGETADQENEMTGSGSGENADQENGKTGSGSGENADQENDMTVSGSRENSFAQNKNEIIGQDEIDSGENGKIINSLYDKKDSTSDQGKQDEGITTGRNVKKRNSFYGNKNPNNDQGVNEIVGGESGKKRKSIYENKNTNNDQRYGMGSGDGVQNKDHKNNASMDNSNNQNKRSNYSLYEYEDSSNKIRSFQRYNSFYGNKNLKNGRPHASKQYNNQTLVYQQTFYQQHQRQSKENTGRKKKPQTQPNNTMMSSQQSLQDDVNYKTQLKKIQMIPISRRISSTRKNSRTKKIPAVVNKTVAQTVAAHLQPKRQQSVNIRNPLRVLKSSTVSASVGGKSIPVESNVGLIFPKENMGSVISNKSIGLFTSNKASIIGAMIARKKRIGAKVDTRRSPGNETTKLVENETVNNGGLNFTEILQPLRHPLELKNETLMMMVQKQVSIFHKLEGD